MMSEYVERLYNTFSETRRIIKGCVHTWKINDFKTIHPGFGNAISAKGEFNGEKVWGCYLYPDGGCDSEEYIGLQVYCYPKSLKIEPQVAYLFLICFLDKNNMEHQVYKSEDKDVEIHNILRLVKRSDVFDEKNGLLANGNLIIRFKAFFKEDIVVNPKSIQINSMKNNPKYNKFENMFNEEKFSDVKISVGDKVFWAYKGILANQSKVFEAMFVHDMKENKENSIEITDIDHEVVQEMLRFIYVGKVDNMEKIARDLLAAADKYEIEDLKSICEETLISELNMETVMSLLVIAEKHGAKLLKETALNFFKLHAKEIIQSEKYKADFDSVVPVLSQIIESLVL